MFCRCVDLREIDPLRVVSVMRRNSDTEVNMTTMDAMNEGRLQQFEAMMEQFAEIQAKYKGVRGELLAKVRAELMRLNPNSRQPAPTPMPAPVAKPVVAAPVAAPAPVAVVARPRPTPNPVIAAALPSCRVCGRGMKRDGDQLKCERGHTRALS